MMIAATTPLDAALEYAALGWPVVPLHTPTDGVCDCPKKEACGDSAGKHPRTIHGLDDATTDEAKIHRWWKIWPHANIGVDLVRAGLLDIAPDSIDWQAEFIARGLPRTANFRSGGGDGHEHHLYRRPDTCPAHRLCKPEEYDVLSAGYAVMPPSLHRSGQRYVWSESPESCPLKEAPSWGVSMLQDVVRSVHRLNSDADNPLEINGSEPPVRLSGTDLETWNGQHPRIKPGGKIERSGSLWDIGCILARAGASRATMQAALQNRDEMLGWSKYTGRRDATTRYRVLTNNVLSGQSPRIRLKPADHNGIAHANGHMVDTATGEVVTEESDEWKWVVYDIDEFMSLEIPPIQWLVDRLIRDQAIVGNFGGPGTLKTYFMTQLAISIAAGEMFLGMFETRQARVLVVEEDTLEADYQQAYLAPMLKAMKIKPAEIKGWLAIAPPGDMLLDQPERLAVLEAKIASYRPSLVCLDAFYLLHSGEGMTAKDLQPILFTLKRLRRKYGCAFWLIDHNRKSSGGQVSDEVAMDRWYGGRSKSAASDAVVETRARKDDDGSASFHVLKMRGSKLPGAIHVRLVDGKMVLDENQSDQAAEGTKILIVEWLLTQQSSRTLNDIKIATKLGSRTVQRCIGEMAKEGRIVKDGKTGHADLWQLAEQAAGPSLEAPWV